ncbi:MAG: amidohydrolase [Synergistales bacterium]|nr:amidohydrolase [Synergistales bacterium]
MDQRVDPAELRAHGAAIADDIIGLRRTIHRHPELAFEERKTADLAARTLDEAGFEVVRGLAGTGVLGILRGAAEGPSRGLRADMDALPLTEETGLSFASSEPGIMHACGHDGHVASLLGAARILADHREHVRGTVCLLFQPAEEGAGGAKRLVREGLFRDFPMDFLFGHHLWTGPGFPKGSFVTRKGIMTAASDRFEISITGRGGHASLPQYTLDPLPVLADLIHAVYAIPSRRLDPFDQAVVSIGRVAAGEAENVIPQEATLAGSIRTFSPGVQQEVHRLLAETAEEISAARGCTGTCSVRRGYPCLQQDEGLTTAVLRLAEAFWGKDQVIEKETPFTGSEDFSYLAGAVPACFAMIGCGGEYGLHSPKMELDEEMLPLLSAWEAYLAIESGALPSTDGTEEKKKEVPQ